ncbi:hypothetical protein [Brevibacterium sediminis]|uniref:hypothetical protein n=1 Tax=Brevibacterium sediminis TaxID=1857024 RepID=UPI00366D0914
MSTVDEILASGRYVDRRGREWVRRLFLRPNIRWANIIRDSDGIGWPGEKISGDRMRLLIERDQHRGECRSLLECDDHPVPQVLLAEGWEFGAGGRFFIIAPRKSAATGGWHDTLPEAMDAARALAVGSCS